MSSPLGNAINTFTALSANGRANDASGRADDANRRANESHSNNLRMDNIRIESAEKSLKDKEFRDWGVGVKGRIDAGGSLAPEDLGRLMDKMGVESTSAFMRDDYATNFDIAGKAFTGEIDPNSRPVLSAANQMWGGAIKKAVGQKTKDGKTIVDQRIVGMAPSKDGDGVMFEIANKTEDGSWYTSPMTEKRSSNSEDDPFVKVISYDSMMQQVQGQKLLHRIRNEKQVRGAFDALLAASTPRKSGGNLSVQDRKGLATHNSRLNMREDAASDGRRSDRENAKSEANRKKAELKAINGMVQQMAETRDERAMMNPGDSDYVDDETIVAIAKMQVNPDLLSPQEYSILDKRRKLRSRRAAEAVLESERDKLNSSFFPGMPSDEEVYEETENRDNYRGPNLRAMLSTQSQSNRAPAQAEAMLQQNPQLKAAFQQKYGYLPQGL